MYQDLGPFPAQHFILQDGSDSGALLTLVLVSMFQFENFPVSHVRMNHCWCKCFECDGSFFRAATLSSFKESGNDNVKQIGNLHSVTLSLVERVCERVSRLMSDFVRFLMCAYFTCLSYHRLSWLFPFLHWTQIAFTLLCSSSFFNSIISGIWYIISQFSRVIDCPPILISNLLNTILPSKVLTMICCNTRPP